MPTQRWQQLVDQAEDDVDLAVVEDRLSHDAGPQLTHAQLVAAFKQAAEAAKHPPV